MTISIDPNDFAAIRAGYDVDPARSYSLSKTAYTEARWASVDRDAIFRKSWQWVCHIEKLRDPGSYVVVRVAEQPVAVLRDREGQLRAFYNVCKHRAPSCKDLISQCFLGTFMDHA